MAKGTHQAYRNLDRYQFMSPPPPTCEHCRTTGYEDEKHDKKFSKFLNIFKNLHINIPFAKVMAQMSTYAKILKEIGFEVVNLIEECFTVVLKKFLPTIRDPWSFTILCIMGNSYFEKALCDLGSSINLMPSLFL
ncbi:hypothetical protein CR513_16695, partial [Mucuna pruriens]